MQRLLRHKLLIGAVAALLAASAGGAYAATQSGGNPQQALINDVAKRLNVTPSQLRAAIQGALLDRLDAAVKAGRLTQAQANQIKQRIQQGEVPLPFAPFWRHRFGFGLAGGPPAPGMIHRGLRAAAGYLGLSRSQLLSDLRGGKTLAQVAHAQGKSVSGLEQAIVSAVTLRLDRLVTAGVITKHQEGLMVGRLSAFVDRLVTSGHVQVRMRGAVSGPGWSPPPVQVPAPSGAGPFGPPPPGP
jgi:hypothetical protein